MERNTGLLWVLGVLGCIAVVLVLMFGIPWYQRYQKVMFAENQIHVNNIIAKQTQQLIDNERQKAQIRIEEAKGIAEAQRLINASLTDKYLQHEAIMAQKHMADSPNHTQIYIPVGNNGIPLVKTIDEDRPINVKVEHKKEK